MKVLYGKNDDYISTNSVAGLGNFDGLHIGHMALINSIKYSAGVSNLTSVIYTFEKHPEKIIRKKLYNPLIITNENKIRLLEKAGIDVVYFDDFTDELSRMGYEDFVKNILIDKLNIKHVVAGYDYKFGYKAKGNTDMLKELGKKYSFDVTIIPKVKSGDETVSSTNIRKQISNGDMHKAFNLLGRYFSMSGTVLPGKKIGSKIGIPTANIYPEKYLVLPLNGVYITLTSIKGRLYKSITNSGVNPTVKDNLKSVIETHILDLNENLYNENIEIFFLQFLREEKKFECVDKLKAQLQKDISYANEYFNANNFHSL